MSLFPLIDQISKKFPNKIVVWFLDHQIIYHMLELSKPKYCLHKQIVDLMMFNTKKP